MKMTNLRNLLGGGALSCLISADTPFSPLRANNAYRERECY